MADIAIRVGIWVKSGELVGLDSNIGGIYRVLVIMGVSVRLRDGMIEMPRVEVWGSGCVCVCVQNVKFRKTIYPSRGYKTYIQV